MEAQQIWMKKEEKWAYILVLRGHEVSRLKVTGSAFTLKGRIKAVMEALEQGTAPAEAGAKSVESLDARTIAKAQVDPDNGSLTLYGEGEKPAELAYSSGEKDAGEILQAILAQSGKTFEPAQEEIGVVEAVLPPVILGGIGAALWFAVYSSANEPAGKEIEVHGRRQGMKRMLIMIGQTLGPNGAIAVGAVLAALILGWMAMRIVKRPERTVWRPAAA